MALFLDTSRGDSDATAYAIGDDVVRVASAHLLARALEDKPEEVLVVIDADFEAALTEYLAWRAQFCDEAGQLLPRFAPAPLTSSFLEEGEPGPAIKVPKGPVEVW